MRLRDGTTLNLTGKSFGLLTVVERAPSDSFGRVYWKCVCRCGEPKVKQAWQLREGRFFTCGKPACRFWEKVYIPEGDSCWEWTGALSDSGYGAFKIMPGKKVPAHVFSWELENKKSVPEGLFVLHQCDYRPCVRPAHLFLGTHQDNMRDMAEKGRARVARPRLTASQRSGIIRASEMGLTHVDNAHQNGTTARTVNRVLNGH